MLNNKSILQSRMWPFQIYGALLSWKVITAFTHSGHLCYLSWKIKNKKSWILTFTYKNKLSFKWNNLKFKNTFCVLYLLEWKQEEFHSTEKLFMVFLLDARIFKFNEQNIILISLKNNIFIWCIRWPAVLMRNTPITILDVIHYFVFCSEGQLSKLNLISQQLRMRKSGTNM